MRGRPRITGEIVNQRLISRGITLITEYGGVNHKAKFKCDHDHLWEARVDHVLGGTGCPHCSMKFPKSRLEINLELSKRGIEVIGESHSMNRSTTFKCTCGTEWMTKPRHVLRGTGCPSCNRNRYGFDAGKPGWEYAFTRDGYLKYGITNDLTRRLNEHKRHGDINLVHERYHERGHDAVTWEKHIKQTHGGRFATKEQCPDGYTETLPIEKLTEVIQ